MSAILYNPADCCHIIRSIYFVKCEYAEECKRKAPKKHLSKKTNKKVEKINEQKNLV